MTITKKQQIRGVRILLTVFYGFLLSSILFHYIIHGIIETIRRPTNPYSITMIALGCLILISIVLAIYATCIVRIVKTAPQRVITSPPVSNTLRNPDESSKEIANTPDSYALAEDITKLIIELISTLFAILGTFVLFRYVKVKYAAVPRAEKAAS